MPNSDVLVSVGLPVFNAGGRLPGVIESVLRQDHEHVELVISDNGSTDATEEICRDLASADRRIRYYRESQNRGLLNNFVQTMRLASGTFFRWIGDDDRLEPQYLSRVLRMFDQDPRLLLVTTQIAYTGPTGEVQTALYDGTGLRSSDPVERFAEMLRLLNESHLLIDPLYGLMRRAPVAAIPRRNMLREDEVFATKLALAGPWGHVPEVLAHRARRMAKIRDLARRLDVPPWQSHLATTLQCREMLRWLNVADLSGEQRRRARAAVYRMYLRRQRLTAARRVRKLVQLAGWRWAETAGGTPGAAATTRPPAPDATSPNCRPAGTAGRGPTRTTAPPQD